MGDLHAFRHAGVHSGADVSSHFHQGGALVAGTALSNVSVVPNRLYAIPFFTARAHQTAAMGIEVGATTAGATATLGVYLINCWSLPLPTSVYYYASGLIVSSANQTVTASIGFPLRAPSLYWLTCMVSASLTLQANDTAKSRGWTIFGVDPTSFSDPNIGLIASYGYGSGTPPQAFPTSFTLTPSAMPSIGFRFATVAS